MCMKVSSSTGKASVPVSFSGHNLERQCVKNALFVFIPCSDTIFLN
jgi:hypothetical protein